jgi:hypothetical protein
LRFSASSRRVRKSDLLSLVRSDGFDSDDRSDGISCLPIRSAMSEVLFELILLRLSGLAGRVRLSIIVVVDFDMPVLGCVEGPAIEGMRALNETEGFVITFLLLDKVLFEFLLLFGLIVLGFAIDELIPAGLLVFEGVRTLIELCNCGIDLLPSVALLVCRLGMTLLGWIILELVTLPGLLITLFLEIPILIRGLMERILGAVFVGTLATLFTCWSLTFLLLLVDFLRCCFAKIGTASSVMLKANRVKIILKSFFCLSVNMI